MIKQCIFCMSFQNKITWNYYIYYCDLWQWAYKSHIAGLTISDELYKYRTGLKRDVLWIKCFRLCTGTFVVGLTY